MMATLPGVEGNTPAGRSGGSAGDAKRKERAARKLEQQETEAAAGIDDVSLCGFAVSRQAAATPADTATGRHQQQHGAVIVQRSCRLGVRYV